MFQDLDILLLGVYPKKFFRIFIGRHVQNVFSRIVFNSPKVEKIQMLINGRTDKDIVEYYKTILYSSVN